MQGQARATGGHLERGKLQLFVPHKDNMLVFAALGRCLTLHHGYVPYDIKSWDRKFLCKEPCGFLGCAFMISALSLLCIVGEICRDITKSLQVIQTKFWKMQNTESINRGIWILSLEEKYIFTRELQLPRLWDQFDVERKAIPLCVADGRDHLPSLTWCLKACQCDSFTFTRSGNPVSIHCWCHLNRNVCAET